ncbi:MAG: 3-hydroxyacyl-CoA dehydrogenase [Sterolibacterium sp.]|nr:3-hydroxyacyl-CoA dehydrogenase [Sterolibacterium sp.]
MSAESLQIVGVIGAGAMGRGIVQLFAQGGHAVKCFDAQEDAAHKARESIAGMLLRAVEKGRISQQEADQTVARISACASLDDLSDCGIVIEAIVEDLEVKRKLFCSLEAVVAEQTILASNTSSLVVSEIAAQCRWPERVAGLHFFNPVLLMKVAEVVAAVRTSPQTVETLKSVISSLGHRAVVTADQPGFLINHAGRGLVTEGLRLLEEQVADCAEVDTLLRDAAGFRMGPFELLDMTGLDVSGKVMESIYEQFHHEPRFRPSSLVRPRVAAGLYGRKTGEGWYRYEGDKKMEPPPRRVPVLAPGLKVWVDDDADHRERIVALAKAAGAEVVASPAGDCLLVVQPWGFDATGYCAENNLDAARCVALDPLPEFKQRRTLMLTVLTTAEKRDAALALFSSDAVPATLINDSPGFVVQRVLATVVNIAANIAQRAIASVKDIEDAVRLGLGYPHGPLTWGDKIGGERVLTILRNMQAVTGDPRYRPSPWLTRRVGLGVSLLTPEAKR